MGSVCEGAAGEIISGGTGKNADAGRDGGVQIAATGNPVVVSARDTPHSAQASSEMITEATRAGR